MAVTPSGELYPCHQFVGDERFLLGDIWKGVTNKRCLSNLKNAMYIHIRNVKIALPNYTVQADVPLTHTIQREV